MRLSFLVVGLALTLLASGTVRGEEALSAPFPEVSSASAPLSLSADEPETTTAGPRIDAGELSTARSGYLHPFLAISGFYTSNLFRTAENAQSDRYAVIVPGIWLALPARQQRPPEIGTANTAPGGLSLSRFTSERERPVQGYAQYQANIRKYDRYREEDRIDHRGEGMLKISARRGLSLEIADVYERNSDPYGTGGKTERNLDTFNANLFNAILVSPLSPKVLLRADYGQYRLNYADAADSYRDRNDDSYAGYLFFRTTARTALFLQGEYIAIDYDEAINVDSRHKNYYLGMQMEAGANRRGRIKAGYGRQESGTVTSEDFLAEAQLDYFFTPRTSLSLQGARRILESDQIGARSILSHQGLLGYQQRLAARWLGNAALFFHRNDYDGTVSIGNRIASNYYYDEVGGRASLDFSPRSWLDISLGYEYRKRDSNFDSEDYRSNTVFLRAAAAL